MRTEMSNPHYSLRWNNHQSHLLTAFDSLLQNETLVDVTLVCEESSFKAHKVVLSACSPYFQRIFSETPCKHPVIVLKDLKGWEVQAIVDFMYRGEISVGQEQLPTLIKAAESLQVRGLAHTERIPVGEKEISRERESRSYSPTSFTPSEEAHSPKYDAFSSRPPITPQSLTFNGPQDRQCTSPIPRRKQARPRRRSGDCGAQDLSARKSGGGCFSNGSSPEVADLSLRKVTPPQPSLPALSQQPLTSLSSQPQHLPRFKSSPTPPAHNNNNNNESEESNGEGTQNQPVELTVNHQEPPPPRLDFLEPLPLPPQHHDSLDNAFPPHLASISQLSLTPPHMFSLESSLGLFPGLENCRGGLLGDLSEPRMDNHHMPVKKKRRCFVVGRPKGQHSAPRGGPPRSWTNAELTEALQHVWNKKMTTSQASRIFGIPYNSLLMYVRGKYGKSLKLEQLKKECFGDVNGPLDLLGLGNISNNNNPTPKSHKIPEPDLMLGPPGFNPSTGYPSSNFYPDFGSSFPVPVGMVHLLPQSEKNREPMNMSLDFSSKDDRGPLDFGKDDRTGVLDFGKDDRTSVTPLDFNTKEERSPPSAPLDFVKEEHHNNIDSDEPKLQLAQHNGD